MTLSELVVEEIHDAGGWEITRFAILPGNEAAAHDLLTFLANQCKLSLANDNNGGGKRSTTYRRTANRIEHMSGGHGWMGKWRIIEETDFIRAVAELEPRNRGGHWCTQGSITMKKGT